MAHFSYMSIHSSSPPPSSHSPIGINAEDAAAATASDGTAAAYQPPEGAESYKFEAEVDRMLDIVVNSLYTNKDVFLREVCLKNNTSRVVLFAP